MNKISVVVPCYNEEAVINLFYNAFFERNKNFNMVDFEIVFVNDGSKDNTLNILKDLASKDNRVKYISFARNFGKESAMLAGFNACTGDYITIMDVDLQDPPELLEEMYHSIVDEGYDCVATRRATRTGEAALKSFLSNMFYKIINKMSSVEIVNGARDFRLMTRQFMNSVLELQEKNRFSKGLLVWPGYNTKWLSYDNVERAAGTTKWNFKKLFKYAIEGIVSFTTAPLLLPFGFGFLSLLTSLILIITTIVKACLHHIAFISGLFATITGLFGLLFICFGIMGEYMAKTYIEIKNRPVYVIKESNIKEAEK